MTRGHGFIALAFAAGLGCGVLLQGLPSARADGEAATAAKPALLVVMGRNYDRDALREYARALPPIYAQYGGEYLAVTRGFEVLEGEYPYESIVVSRWPSLAAARAFWHSPQYTQAKQIRAGNGEFDVIAFEALPAATASAPLARED